jgi:hypothetical protein
VLEQSRHKITVIDHDGVNMLLNDHIQVLPWKDPARSGSQHTTPKLPGILRSEKRIALASPSTLKAIEKAETSSKYVPPSTQNMKFKPKRRASFQSQIG